MARRRQVDPGYGHPLHKERDARVGALFDMARGAGTDLRFVAIAEAARRLLPELLKKDLKLNVSGAIPAVLLGAGFPVQALKGVPILARTAGLIAHLVEEIGSRSASRCRTRRRARSTTTATSGGLRRKARRDAKHAHDQDARTASRSSNRAPSSPARPRHAARRPRRRRGQGRAGDRRSVPRLPGRPLQPALPGLQPQQAQHRARHSRSAADREVFDALIADADVYIQNFRPASPTRSAPARRGCAAINPRLVYCSISGFGPTGPVGDRPAYDTVAQAASGFLNLLVNPENPRVVGPAIADSLTGFYAAYGIMGALIERGRTGVGRTVEVSMLEAMAHFNLDAFTHSSRPAR